MDEKTLNFSVYQAKKHGVVTAQTLLESTLKRADSLEQVVIITIDKEGYIQTGWSNAGSIRTLGIMEVAKNQILDEMKQ